MLICPKQFPKQFLTECLHKSNPLMWSVLHQPGPFTRVGCRPKQAVQKWNPQSLALLNMSQSSNYLQNTDFVQKEGIVHGIMEPCGLEDIVMLGKSLCSYFLSWCKQPSLTWEAWQKRSDVCEIVHLVGRCCANSFGPCNWRENFHVSKATFDYFCYNLKPLVEKQNTSMRRPVSVSYNFMDTSNTFRIS